MLRAALSTLVVASTLSGSLQAQRAGATFRGSAGAPVRSGFVGQSGFSNRSFPRRGVFSTRFQFRHDGFGTNFVPYFVPYYEPYEYDQPYGEAAPNGPPVVVVQSNDRPAPTPEPAKAQVIEIPSVARSSAPKMLPPALFILANGEQLEARRFVLTANTLSVSIERKQRTIPLDMLDIDATLTANRERGIDLQIPADRNEISLSF